MKRIAAAALMAGLNGCATLFHGAQQDTEIVTQPRGAVIAREGKAVGITPAMLKLDRSERRVAFRLTLEGYEPDSVAFERRFNWWSLAEDYGVWYLATFLYDWSGHPGYSKGYLAVSAFLGSLYFSNASFAIDALTGAVWRQTPRAAEVVLQPSPEPPLAAATLSSTGLAAPALSTTAPGDPAPAR